MTSAGALAALLTLLACTKPTLYPGVPVLADAPLNLDTAVEGLPCSGQLAFEANTMTILSHHPEPLQLFWRDVYCNESFYGDVEPEVPFDQPANLESMWVLRAADGGYVDHMYVDNVLRPFTWETP